MTTDSDEHREPPASSIAGSGTPSVRPRLRARAAIALGVVVVLVLTGGAIALAAGNDTDSDADASAVDATSPDHAAAHTHEEVGATGLNEPEEGGAAPHDHAALPPYEMRDADATDAERAAAEALQANVATTLAEFADPARAVAAGYEVPRQPNSPMWHYRNRSLRGAATLDPSQPNGLVYYTAEGRAPVLAGAYFIARPGVPAPIPAGDLVSWHTHDDSCPEFFVTAADACIGTVRMLHVWTVDTLDWVRRTGEVAPVRITDPFGAPFTASIERVR